MIETAYYWYLLSTTSGFGAKSIHYINDNLNKNHLSVRDLFILSHSELSSLFPAIGQGKFSKADFKALHFSNNDEQHTVYEKLKSEGICMIALDDERYPKQVLANIQQEAPPLLYCKGHLPLLNKRSISIVGSRTIDESVAALSGNFAGSLSEKGFAVTSGYAKGVDSAAHTGALKAYGATIAVLSYGISSVERKKEIEELQTETNTLFVSQFNPFEKFSGQNAMIRNKLVCALSEALVVIASGPEKDETGKNSGTFSAARFAFGMQLPVFVVSPKHFKISPGGNEDIIKIGGIEFSDTNEITNYLTEQPSRIERTKTKKYDTTQPPPGQMSLF